tara:strand:+ start:532 stop:771 length:240 start_codon:yes stop_codon:yes gene_type:complete
MAKAAEGAAAVVAATQADKYLPHLSLICANYVSCATGGLNAICGRQAYICAPAGMFRRAWLFVHAGWKGHLRGEQWPGC